VRIVSLLPSATEIVAAIGLGDRLVGRTHECDWPAPVAAVPVVTRDLLSCDPANAAGIDRAVAAAAAAGERLAGLDEAALRRARPDLIVTQALCGVCAIEQEQVQEVADRLPGRPEVLSLEPTTLEGVLQSILVVGAATGAAAEAAALVEGLRARLARVRAATAGRRRPRVVCLEWLDPPYVAGHWIPEQVRAAGGHDPLGRPGRPSARVAPERVAAADPEVLVLVPCGWDVARTLDAIGGEPLLAPYAGTRAVRDGRVVVLDGSGCFSRPGPRLVEGVERLASALHPEAVSALAPARRAQG
jgi:iron complex transport system substrate-binding protein